MDIALFFNHCWLRFQVLVKICCKLNDQEGGGTSQKSGDIPMEAKVTTVAARSEVYSTQTLS